tara:strand:- start:20941 stop:21873 length:933 start_codon:yes stop_codon:yes gene_type:complete
MRFDYKDLSIAALSAVLFMSVYHVFSLIIYGPFMVSFLFLFNSVLSTLALLATNKPQGINTKFTSSVLLLSCFSLFIFMLTQIETASSMSTWFCILVFCSSVLLAPSHALRLNLMTLCIYWILTLWLTNQTFQQIESALALTLITILVTILSQVTKGLKDKLELSRKTDALTGCIQPTEFKFELAKVTQLFERYDTPFSLICIKYSSSFSSESELQTWLKELAQLYQSRLRKTDILCRFSSQRFMILLPSTQHKNATALCSDLKRCAEAYEFSYQKSAQQNHVKTDLTLTTETYSEKDNIDEWLQQMQVK